MDNSRQFKKPDLSKPDTTGQFKNAEERLSQTGSRAAMEAKLSTTGSRAAMEARMSTTGSRQAFDNTAGYRLADRILERSKQIEMELQAPVPRKVAPLETSGHTHLARGLLIGAFVGLLILVMYLSLISYQTYNDLPIFPLALMVLGLGLLGFFTFKHVPADCDCKTQRLMVVNGKAVIGQITEKRDTKTPEGKARYHFDYVFQPEGQTDSAWGSMQVSEAEFRTIFEGDDITVLYTSGSDELVSRLYRFCAFQAIAGKEQFLGAIE